MAAEETKSGPPISDVPPVIPSTERISLSRMLPTDWLDRLLLAHCAIEPSEPLDEGARHILAVAQEIFEGASLGVCIAAPADRDGDDAGGQMIVRAPARPGLGVSPDPTRLFPELEVERVFPIPVFRGRTTGDDGSTLHVAWDDDEDRFASGAAAAFVDRLAHVLGSIIGNHRAVDRARNHAVGPLRAQVIQSEKLASLGQIAAGVVHELNNPLTSIVAYSDYLRTKYTAAAGDPADIERLSRIHEAAERILRFSRDLTEYSRPSREAPAEVSIHDVIDRALGFCEHELDGAGVMVERHFGETRAVRGVASQLTQVFVNLFTNAAHAMREEGGMLAVRTAMQADGKVLVTVSDDGHGIDADALPRVFDPFFTTKPDGTGTGLGLTIVRSIIVSHGGDIRAKSNVPRGTTFHIELEAVH